MSLHVGNIHTEPEIGSEGLDERCQTICQDINPRLYKAMSSEEEYDRLYIEISENAASGYHMAYFPRSECSVRSDIANLH